MPYFKRDKVAANNQQRHWEGLVKTAKRLAEYTPQNCTYCGVHMTAFDPEHPNRGTAETKDHIVPKSKGGTLIVPCCVTCNRDKHHLTVGEWRCVLMLRRRRPVLYHFERIALKNRALEMIYILSRLLSC